MPRWTQALISCALSVLSVLSLTWATSAAAADWPSMPLRLVLPYPPGGNVDGAARIVAAELQRELSQTVLVENRAGAGGMLAGEAVAKAAPDGYTLFFTANGPLLYSPTIYGRPLYHWQKDFVPISSVSFTPLVLLVNPTVPANSVKELLALARSKPESIAMASPGAGTTNHLISEMMQRVSGVKWLTVQYKGNAPATTDLLGGQVQFDFDQVSVALPFVKQGRLRALAVVGSKRVPWLPDVPSLAEQGIAGIEGVTFTGLVAPAGTPAAIVNRLSELLRKILKDPAVVQRFYAAGAEARGMSPDEFTSFLKQEEATWMPIIESAQIRFK